MTEQRMREIAREEYAAIKQEEAVKMRRGLRTQALQFWAKSEGKARMSGALYDDLWEAVDRGASQEELLALVDA